jgi:hypothetical protein
MLNKIILIGKFKIDNFYYIKFRTFKIHIIYILSSIHSPYRMDFIFTSKFKYLLVIFLYLCYTISKVKYSILSPLKEGFTYEKD